MNNFIVLTRRPKIQFWNFQYTTKPCIVGVTKWFRSLSVGCLWLAITVQTHQRHKNYIARRCRPWRGGLVSIYFDIALLVWLFFCMGFICLYRYVHILENNKPDDFTDEGQMKLQLKIIQLLKLDLQRAIEFHDKLFIK